MQTPKAAGKVIAWAKANPVMAGGIVLAVIVLIYLASRQVGAEKMSYTESPLTDDLAGGSGTGLMEEEPLQGELPVIIYGGLEAAFNPYVSTSGSYNFSMLGQVGDKGKIAGVVPVPGVKGKIAGVAPVPGAKGKIAGVAPVPTMGMQLPTIPLPPKVKTPAVAPPAPSGRGFIQ